jgi:hypothetical protein
MVSRADITAVIRRFMPSAVPRALVAFHPIYLRWKSPCDPSGVTFFDAAQRIEVSPQEFHPEPRLAVVLALGASNLANEGEPGELFAPERGVYNFNFLNGRCYVACDPLLGTTLDRSNVVTRLADRLVTQGVYDRVLLVPVAYGGTFIVEWAPGGRMHRRLLQAFKTLRRAGLRPTHILWQQGEAEANHPSGANDVQAWTACFEKVTDVIRAAEPDAPIYVARATICHGGPSEAIRSAQISVVDPKRGVFAGPDLDTIGADGRWDGCHFSTTGLQRSAALWCESLTASESEAADFE